MVKKKDTPLGSSNFKKIREENRYYVDKSMLVRHVIKGQDIILLCRPRRFGKTLNMDMLRCFFSKNEDNGHLFEGLNISRDEESMAHLGKYPVVFISMKEAKQDSVTEVFKRIRRALLEAWKNHRYLAKSQEVGEEFNQMFAKMEDPKTDLSDLAWSLRQLTELLYRHHKSPAVILIDEYDTPVHASWLYGYYDEMVFFMKDLLGSAMKDNPYLKKGVLTGILRVAKESMFSDLNNFIPSTVLDTDLFSDQFGFTEEEVLEMFAHYDMNGREVESLHEWYDGYRFGGHRIYNPWSILNYVFSLNHDLKPYWVNTSQDSLLRRLFFREKTNLREQIQPLIRGEKFTVQLSDHLVFKDLGDNLTATWTLLVMAGYLKAEPLSGLGQYEVSIPNREIRYAFTDSISTWLNSDMKASTRDQMLESLTAGRAKNFEYYLAEFVLQVFSYYDTERRYAENFYHAFFLGLFAGLDHRYELRSNREEGYGRYDICLTPRPDYRDSERGIVIEIKAPDTKAGETLADALAEAKAQMLLNKYDTALRDAGVSQVMRLAIAVQGKEVEVAEV